MPAIRECPPIERWQSILAEEMSPDEMAGYEQHLEFCSACQQLLDQDDACREAWRLVGQRVGDPTCIPGDPTLAEVVRRLHGVKSVVRPSPVAPADLYFLRPGNRPDLLGRLGEYEVEEIIGQGGMGVVLKASDPSLHRMVAIKVMAPAVAGSAVARQRFKREAQAAAAVCHDHVVTVYGVHEVDGLPYLVMQYVSGESLQTRLDNTGPLEVIDIVRIGMQTAQGLAAAHAQGLIHRDIKPANLLLEDGLARVKITDFGLARMVDEARLTQSGVVAGTPEYMAPEQARGEHVDHRADLFSLGSVLYACCTGLPPFRGSTAIAVLRMVNDKTPTPIRSLNPDIPEWLEMLVAGLMIKDPERRFQSASEVAALLEGYLAHLRQPVTIAPPELPPMLTQSLTGRTAGPRSAMWLWVPTMVLLALLGLGMGWWFAAGPGEKEEEQEWYQHFQGSTELKPGVKKFGIEPEKYVTLEGDGLRITLPAGHDEQRPLTGLVTSFGMRGDFEITLAFEVLHEMRGLDNPRNTTGLSLEVIPQRPPVIDPERWIKPSQDRAGVSRLVGLQDQTLFLAKMSQWNGIEGKEEVKGRRAMPTTAKSGRLRLNRTGSDLFFYVSEGDGDFTLLHQDTFGDRDIRQVRIVATTSGAMAAFTVRIKELHIRGHLLTGEAKTASKKARTWWLPVVGALSAILVLNVGVWLLVRRRKRARMAAPAAARPERDAPAKTADVSVISFRCAGCDRPVKARAELAGKKVKCRHCSQVMQVPKSNSDENNEAGIVRDLS